MRYPGCWARNGLSLQDSTSTKSTRRLPRGARASGGVESGRSCKRWLGLDAALGSIDRSKLNVNGSSLAAGHPFAATGGGRILGADRRCARREEGEKAMADGCAPISICAAGAKVWLRFGGLTPLAQWALMEVPEGRRAARNVV